MDSATLMGLFHWYFCAKLICVSITSSTTLSWAQNGLPLNGAKVRHLADRRQPLVTLLLPLKEACFKTKLMSVGDF